MSNVTNKQNNSLKWNMNDKSHAQLYSELLSWTTNNLHVITPSSFEKFTGKTMPDDFIENFDGAYAQLLNIYVTGMLNNYKFIDSSNNGKGCKVFIESLSVETQIDFFKNVIENPIRTIEILKILRDKRMNGNKEIPNMFSLIHKLKMKTANIFITNKIIGKSDEQNIQMGNSAFIENFENITGHEYESLNMNNLIGYCTKYAANSFVEAYNNTDARGRKVLFTNNSQKQLNLLNSIINTQYSDNGVITQLDKSEIRKHAETIYNDYFQDNPCSNIILTLIEIMINDNGIEQTKTDIETEVNYISDYLKSHSINKIKFESFFMTTFDEKITEQYNDWVRENGNPRQPINYINNIKQIALTYCNINYNEVIDIYDSNTIGMIELLIYGYNEERAIEIINKTLHNIKKSDLNDDETLSLHFQNAISDPYTKIWVKRNITNWITNNGKSTRQRIIKPKLTNPKTTKTKDLLVMTNDIITNGIITNDIITNDIITNDIITDTNEVTEDKPKTTKTNEVIEDKPKINDTDEVTEDNSKTTDTNEVTKNTSNTIEILEEPKTSFKVKLMPATIITEQAKEICNKDINGYMDLEEGSDAFLIVELLIINLGYLEALSITCSSLKKISPITYSSGKDNNIGRDFRNTIDDLDVRNMINDGEINKWGGKRKWAPDDDWYYTTKKTITSYSKIGTPKEILDKKEWAKQKAIMMAERIGINDSKLISAIYLSLFLTNEKTVVKSFNKCIKNGERISNFIDYLPSTLFNSSKSIRNIVKLSRSNQGTGRSNHIQITSNNEITYLRTQDFVINIRAQEDKNITLEHYKKLVDNSVINSAKIDYWSALSIQNWKTNTKIKPIMEKMKSEFNIDDKMIQILMLSTFIAEHTGPPYDLSTMDRTYKYRLKVHLDFESINNKNKPKRVFEKSSPTGCLGLAQFSTSSWGDIIKRLKLKDEIPPDNKKGLKKYPKDRDIGAIVPEIAVDMNLLHHMLRFSDYDRPLAIAGDLNPLKKFKDEGHFDNPEDLLAFLAVSYNAGAVCIAAFERANQYNKKNGTNLKGLDAMEKGLELIYGKNPKGIFVSDDGKTYDYKNTQGYDYFRKVRPIIEELVTLNSPIASN